MTKRMWLHLELPVIHLVAILLLWFVGAFWTGHTLGKRSVSCPLEMPPVIVEPYNGPEIP